uniref:Secreted protein n=1 Tax=Peronospora matthiolae TaxID=2874970 RepID=A0AAV1UWI8_9STRA
MMISVAVTRMMASGFRLLVAARPVVPKLQPLNVGGSAADLRLAKALVSVIDVKVAVCVVCLTATVLGTMVDCAEPSVPIAKEQFTLE